MSKFADAFDKLNWRKDELALTTKYDFMWVTQQGEEMFLEEMQTTHLFYSVRMMFNHTVPPGFVIPGCKTYDMRRFPVERRTMACVAMLEELEIRKQRRQVPGWMQDQLNYMIRTCGQLATKTLPNGPARLPVS